MRPAYSVPLCDEHFRRLYAQSAHTVKQKATEHRGWSVASRRRIDMQRVSSPSLCYVRSMALSQQRSAAYALYSIAQLLEPTFDPIAVIALDLDTVAFYRPSGATEFLE